MDISELKKMTPEDLLQAVQDMLIDPERDSDYQLAVEFNNELTMLAAGIVYAVSISQNIPLMKLTLLIPVIKESLVTAYVNGRKHGEPIPDVFKEAFR